MRAKLPSRPLGSFQRLDDGEGVDEVLDLDLFVVRDAGQVDPAIPIYQLLVIDLKLPELMFGQRQAELPCSFHQSFHHGRFMIAQGLALDHGQGGPKVSGLISVSRSEYD